MNKEQFKPKTFWKRPEGVTGTIFMAGLIGAGLYFSAPILATIQAAIASTIGIVGLAVVLAAIVYMVADKRMRNLVWYSYKSVMRWITGMFVQLDPIGVLKSYIDDLQNLSFSRKDINLYVFKL